MTSPLATNSRVYQLVVNGKASALLADKRTGIPAEGQVPHSWTTQSSAGELNIFYETTILGANATLSDATLKNAVGRYLVVKVNTPSAYTLTLSGALKFNGGTTNIATFSGVSESCLVLSVTASTTNTVLVNVVSSRNVTFS